jgi:single stranded DNA-binding protein
MKEMTIIGHVGHDAEIRVNTQTGNEFATFSVAVSVGTKDNPRTDWVDVVCNNKLVEVAQKHVKTGSKFLVRGFPTAIAFNQNGVLKAKNRISAERIRLLSRKAEEGEDYSQEFPEAPADDEIPNF